MRICNNIAMLLKTIILNEYLYKNTIFANHWPFRQFCIHKNDFILKQQVFRSTLGDFFYTQYVSCLLMYRKVVYLPVALIKKANNEGWLRSLAYYVRMKSLYKNNTHYNFTLRSLSAKLECSPGCLSYHLKELNNNGLLRCHGGNLTFVGLNKLCGLYKKASIGVTVDFKNQYDILRGQIIRFNLSAQEYNIRKSGTQKHCKQYVQNTYYEKANSCYTGLSALGVGGLFCLSGQTGSRLRKKLKDLGLFKVTKVYSCLYRNVSFKDYKKMKWLGYIPVYAKYINNSIIIEKRNKIEYIK